MLLQAIWESAIPLCMKYKTLVDMKNNWANVLDVLVN